MKPVHAFLLAATALLTGCGSAAQQMEQGQRVYERNCAGCHLADGTGTPNVHPSLPASSVVPGDPNLLIRAMIQGPNNVIPAYKPPYNATMPPYDAMSDNDMAAVITYMRQTFGKGASPVSTADVAAVRASLGGH